jgi:serralysin
MPASWTEQQIVDNLLRADMYWTTPTVSYGFPTTAGSWFANGEGPGFSAFLETQKAAARLAMSLWDDLAAIDFTESAGAAQVTFQNTTTDIGYAHAYYPGTWGPAGSIWLNPNYNSSSGGNDLVTPTVGKWGFNTYLHEIGHALGLEHPGEYPQGATYAANAPYLQDTVQYSVMSYFAASNTGADWVASNNQSYSPQTPMLHDILAIQALYGVETTTRTGNTIYGFGSNADRSVYNFTTNAHPVLTIWDAGGLDTLNLSGFSTASRIDLNAGSYSDCDGMTKNIAIAFNCFIENATGGSGNDSITGNALANLLRGSAGNDSLIGGDGNDTLDGGTGSDSLQGGNGIDSADYRYGVAVDINLATNTFTGGAAGDSFVSIERFFGSNGGNDVFTGGNGTDYLYGVAGNDTFFGSLGKDFLFGGAGNDLFVYSAVTHAGNGSVRDRIADFAINLDDINLSAIDAITGGANDAFTFIGAAAFGNTAGQLRTVQSTTFTLVEGDIDGNGLADFQIELTGLLTLTAGDFIL